MMTGTRDIGWMHLFAYFFPGVAVLVGAWVIYAVVVDKPIGAPEVGVVTGTAGIALSYVLGVICSAVSPFRSWKNNMGDPDSAYDLKKAIQCESLRKQFLAAYGEVTGDPLRNGCQWNGDKATLCAHLLREQSPGAWQSAGRQSMIRQLRHNAALPILVWASAGVGYVISVEEWGLSITMAVGTIITGAAAGSLCALGRAAKGNLTREMKEVCMGIVALQKLNRIGDGGQASR